MLPPVEVAPTESAAKPQVPRRSTGKRERQHIVRAPRPEPLVSPPVPGVSAANLFPTVVVSPTGVVTPANLVANSVTVLTARDMERDQRRTASDALSAVPGLNLVQTGGPGGQASIFMRGTNSNHTKVLIDGIDVSDPSSPNRSFDLGKLLTSDLQQIEVLRGPQSGLYGADALGGVISMVTKKGDGPARVTGSIEGGSFGTFNQTTGLSGSQDHFNYAFNVAHFHANDVPVTPVELLPPGQKAIGNYHDNMTYSTKLGADVSEYLALNGVARYTDATLRFTGDTFDPVTFASFPAAAQSTQTVHQLFTRGEAVWSALNDRMKSYFGVNNTNHWNYNISPGDAMPTITTGDRIKYDWRTTTELARNNNFIIGAEHETETLQTATVSAQNVNKAGYMELQSQLRDRVFFTANVRQDDNERFGGHPTFRLASAVIVPVADTKFKGSYGTGFKAPTLNQLFVGFPAFFFFANPNLKPEESVGYDAGFEQPLFNDRVRFGSTYFRNNITDLIQSMSDAVTFTSTNVNIGKAITEGTESFVAAAITDRLRVRADYTFTRAVDATAGLELLRRPKERWSANVIWDPIDTLTLSATVLHVGSFVDGSRDFSIPRLLAPAYTVANVAAEYLVTDQLKVFGRVDNLANAHYQNPTGFLQPGLAVYGGIRLANHDVR
ncbi:TonB-dependent receptor plug domain-containing protein [Bradyrhizobium manausense]|uniref:TonB-dependent receptor plug domain-containing protein n=1 Tax=Bradyrhizobium manausense TaxID=989370 RepID=UPI002012B073|nr:TonB-dependent receptor [Bradyrhizobium manausense]